MPSVLFSDFSKRHSNRDSFYASLRGIAYSLIEKTRQFIFAAMHNAVLACAARGRLASCSSIAGDALSSQRRVHHE
ncbi:hypothetical protein QYH69_26755 [Paraburkholderia sp. SARCC-3016]|nr:hypothetical protein [Paraburkholderia sp. SARCC-3016]